MNISVPRLPSLLPSRRSNPGVLLTLTWMLAGPGIALGAGFQIPNQSLKAIGSAGANLAYTTGPDAAYYNPANMSFLDDHLQLEASLTTLWLPEITYRDTRGAFLDGESDFEIFDLPQLHIASQDYRDFRFGFSLTYPYGLAKHWDQPFPGASTEKFSLEVIEASPSVSYRLNDQLSIGGGVRFIYAKGEVRSNASNPPIAIIPPDVSLGRDMEADDIAFGYNLAATYRPTREWRLAATYRSGVDLELDGDATLTAALGGLPLPGN